MTAPTANAYRTTTLRTQGFSCPSCVKKIETALDVIPGVASAEVKFSSGRVIVSHDPELVDVNDLIEVVTKLGYPVQNAGL